MFSSTMFNKGDQASFVYADSKTNEKKTRTGIVETVGSTFVRLEMVCPTTQKTIFRSFNYDKMQKLG